MAFFDRRKRRSSFSEPWTCACLLSVLSHGIAMYSTHFPVFYQICTQYTNELLKSSTSLHEMLTFQHEKCRNEGLPFVNVWRFSIAPFISNLAGYCCRPSLLGYIAFCFSTVCQLPRQLAELLLVFEVQLKQ